MESLQLIEANPMKSEVMSRAAELRDEGYDRSDALSMAWDDILGEDYGLDDDEEDEDIFPKTKTRRNPTSNPPDTMGIGALLLLGGVSYLAWCAYKYSQTKVWSWTPWRTVPVSRRLMPSLTAMEPVLPRQAWPGEAITLIVP